MQKSDLERFENWFADFVAGHYGDDEFVNNHIKLKEDHTARVRQEINYLTSHSGFGENDCFLAETIALFHDVGRFPQFAKYRTFNDVVSVNHSTLSAQTLKEQKILSDLPKEEQDIILKSVILHGVKMVPADIDERVAMFTKLIRDADKLDIYMLLIEQYTIYHNDPESFHLDLELPDEPRYTDEVIESAIKGELIDYKLLRTLNDIKILKIGWVHDINYPAAIQRIKQQRYIDGLFGFLPTDDKIEELKAATLAYMDERINNSK